LAVEVSTLGAAATAGTGSALVAVLHGGRRIEVGRGFETRLLEQLVRVLEGL
jgi:N-acetylglucosamine kinase-like BadF-type ATPase